MQSRSSRKMMLFALAASCAALALPAHAQRASATLNGYQEVPSISTRADGTLRATVTRNNIDYRVDFRRINSRVTQAHIHFAQAGVNGAVSVFLCSDLDDPSAGTQACPNGASGRIEGSITSADVIGPAAQGLSPGDFDALVAAMEAGSAYVNVHTTDFPGGEIRGQVVVGGGGGGPDDQKRRTR